MGLLAFIGGKKEGGYLPEYEDVPYFPPFDGLLRDGKTGVVAIMPNYIALLFWIFCMFQILAVVIFFADERVTPYVPEAWFLNQKAGATSMTRAAGVAEYGLGLIIKTAVYTCGIFCAGIQAKRLLGGKKKKK